MQGWHYPTWRSLACNYLAIMASSMSSECVFSSAGITITKCCNHLKGDIVKALQCIKSFIHQDILFHEVITATLHTRKHTWISQIKSQPITMQRHMLLFKMERSGLGTNWRRL